MIVGIGVDIIEVSRVQKYIAKDNGFKEKVFSKKEIVFCESKGKNKAQHYATRFAAKEAFLKATGQGLLLSNDLNEIEVEVMESGKPEILLAGKLASVTKINKWMVYVSLAHLRSTACAMVVIESVENLEPPIPSEEKSA